jgi:hypothetical protein
VSRPRFLADEDLRGSIVRAVRRAAPTVIFTTVVEQGWSSATDENVLDAAWQEHWLVVSHDVNTMKAIAEQRVSQGRGLHGLFLAPQRRSVPMVAECIVLIAEASEFEEWRNRIVYLPF